MSYDTIIFQILLVADTFHVSDTVRDSMVVLERKILVFLYRSWNSSLYISTARHVSGEQRRAQVGYETI